MKNNYIVGETKAIDDIPLLVIGDLILRNGKWNGKACDMCTHIISTFLSPNGISMRLTPKMVGRVLNTQKDIFGSIFNYLGRHLNEGYMYYSFDGIKADDADQFCKAILADIRARFIDRKAPKIKAITIWTNIDDPDWH